MKSISKVIFMAIAMTIISTLTGCAALSDFKRPPEDKVVLGKTTGSEIKKMMGDPSERDQETNLNGEPIRLIIYDFSTGTGLPGTITPYHKLVYYVNKNDVVFGEIFNSTFDADSTAFKLEKVGQIIKGKSTKADVIGLLGKPSGKIIYPYTQLETDTGIIYGYKYWRGAIPGFHDTRVVVYLDKNEIVKDISYTNMKQGKFIPYDQAVSDEKK
jgi:outer membrane protein assembly factor BamE (lipoprotein component of BamABCDE complex)